MSINNIDRRQYLYGLGASLGSVAFSSMLAADDKASLAAKRGHVKARAKSCIFLMMEGGPSHIDTFDPKPKLRRLHLQRFQRRDDKLSGMAVGTRYYVESPFAFHQAGQCGADLSTDWYHLSKVADEICFYRGCQVESINHPTAMYHMNTGNRFGGDPAIGAWATYGLGTENADLPGFIILPELAYPQGGAANWSNGFLPAPFQGTPLRPRGSPILDLRAPPGVTPAHQRRNLELLGQLNRRHLARHPEHGDLRARMANYELAFRMQMEVPGLLDLEKEDARTKALYGIDEPETDAFARKCLLARRLIEKGVRFVQAYHGTWDSHDFIGKAHRTLVGNVDKPVAGLIQDLKQRGLLEETLIIWGGEFGRSPDNGFRNGTAYGRDHNAKAMTLWFAGGGVKAGHTIGATDEIGEEAAEVIHPIRDVHVTLLHLLGLDDNRLTYYHAGRFKQLSQFGGKVIQDLMI